MPARKRWLERLPEICRALAALDIPIVDREIVESVFGVRRRRAVQLMRSFGGFQSGRTFLVDRLVLLAQLRHLQEGPEFQGEVRRRQRLIECLERLRQHHTASRVAIPVAQDIFSRKLRDLPEGILLEPGCLRVEFDGAEDLLRKLYELAQAVANDFERFQAAAGS